MKPKYRYEYHTHYTPPSTFEYQFNSMVEEGWRLVSIVKEHKASFVSYWEKPYED